MSSRGRMLVELAKAVDNTSDRTNQASQQGHTVKKGTDGLRQSGLTTEIGPATETQIARFGVYIFNTKYDLLTLCLLEKQCRNPKSICFDIKICLVTFIMFNS